jgi:hypothetical protein
LHETLSTEKIIYGVTKDPIDLVSGAAGKGVDDTVDGVVLLSNKMFQMF